MKPKLRQGMTIFAAAFHLLSLPGLFILGMFNPSVSKSVVEIILVLLCLGWMPVASLTLLWLGWQERKRLQNTMIWLGINLLFLLLLLGGGSHIAPIRLVSGMYFLPFLSLLFWSDILYAVQRHLGLRLAAVGSLVYVWSIVLAWRIWGNPLIMFLDTPEMSGTLLWMNAVMYWTGAMVLAGLVAVAVDIFVLFAGLQMPLSE